MSFLLPALSSKKDIDDVIRNTADKIVVLRFGRQYDVTCLQLDQILEKSVDDVGNMAVIYTVEVDEVPVYRRYFDITLIPSTIFFFNSQHIKVDWETADHTKFIGSFKTKQDFLDVVEVIYRGVMKGKIMIRSPLDPRSVPKYELIYKDI